MKRLTGLVWAFVASLFAATCVQAEDNFESFNDPWRNFGIDLGLRYFNVDVDSKGSDLNGAFEFEYFGPALYVAVTF